VDNVVGEGKYLGLLTPKGRMNKERFKTTKEKMVKCCSGWAEKHMSSTAKEVLIKFVAQAIPTYTMGVFKLPLNLCEELNQVIREFWRGGEGGRTGRERSIGLHGIKCYDLKEKGGGGSDFKIWRLLIKLY
jgi:hypothetical protein